MRMIDGLRTIKDIVGKLLNDYPVLRDSDKLLWLAYLNYRHELRSIIGEEAYIKLKTVIMHEDTPTMESIRRIRQKYQENGLYVGEKRQERLVESECVKDWAVKS